VIFDFDGVLVDSPSYYFKHMKEHLHNLDRSVSDEDISHLVGMTFDKKLDYINRFYGLSIERDEFVEATSARMRLDMERKLLPDERLNIFLGELKGSGVELAIASNNVRKNIDFILGKLGLTGVFSSISSFDSSLRPKPAPDIYLKALGMLGKDADNCVAIEDTGIGVEAAKSAGLMVVAMPNRFTSLNDFTLADAVVSGFGELSSQRLAELV